MSSAVLMYRRVAVAVAPLTAIVAFLLLVGSSSGGGSEGGGPSAGPERESRSAQGLKELNRVLANLAAAEDHEDKASKDFEQELRDAHEDKRDFIEIAFSAYTYLENCNTATLILTLDQINSEIHSGLYRQGKERRESLFNALAAARDLANGVDGCAPGSVARTDALLANVRRFIGAHEDGKIRNDKAQRNYRLRRIQILLESRDLIASAPDQVKGGCEVPGFYRELESLDGFITTAAGVTPGFLLGFRKDVDADTEQKADKDARASRRENVTKASQKTVELIRTWRACSPPACDDGKDNDSDGSIDDGDLGCHTGVGGGVGAAPYDPDDQSEEKRRLSPHLCPAAGPPMQQPVKVGERVQVTDRGAGDEMFGFNLRNITTGEVIFQRNVETSPDDFTHGEQRGPVSLGDLLCGPGTTATIEWVRADTSIIFDFEVTKPNDVASRGDSFVVASNTR